MGGKISSYVAATGICVRTGKVVCFWCCFRSLTSLLMFRVLIQSMKRSWKLVQSYNAKNLEIGKNPFSTALSTFFPNSNRNITDETCMWFNPNFVMLFQSSRSLIILKSIIICNFHFSPLEKFPVVRPIFITADYSFLPSVLSHIDTHLRNP